MLRRPPLPSNSAKRRLWHSIEEGVMRNMYSSERLFEDLFGFRRQFEEIFNRILTGKPWGLEPPEFKKPFNIAPAVEAYVDKEAKKYVCRVTLAGVEPKDLQIHAQANVLTIRGERKLSHSTKEIELMEGEIVYGVFERTLELPEGVNVEKLDRKSTRLNSSHSQISYAVFCLKKKHSHSSTRSARPIPDRPS